MPHSITAEYNHSANASNPPRTQTVTVAAYSNASFTLSPSEYPDSSRVELDEAQLLGGGSVRANMDNLKGGVQDACEHYLKDHSDFPTRVNLDSFVEHNGESQRRIVVCGHPKMCDAQKNKHHIQHTAQFLAVTNWVPEQDCDSTVTPSNFESKVTKVDASESHFSAGSVNSRPQVQLEKPVDHKAQTEATFLDKQFASLVDDGVESVTYSPCGTFISWVSQGGMGRFVGKDPRNGQFGFWTMD